VHDALIVSFGDGVERLQAHVHGLADGQRSTRVAQRLQIFALEVLHHHVRHAGFGLTDVVDLHHVLGADACRRPRLAHEALDHLGVVTELLLQELEDHRPAEQLVVARDDGAHAPGREQCAHPVFAGHERAHLDRRRFLVRVAS
jgi:hypothetical protein